MTTLDVSDISVEAIAAKDSQPLISLHQRLKGEREELTVVIGRIERELARRMEAKKATKLPHPEYDVKGSRKVTYRDDILMRLLELSPEQELVDAKAYEPAHEKTISVPATFNMTHTKPLANLGEEHAEIIQDAKLEGPLEVKITKKKGK